MRAIAFILLTAVSSLLGAAPAYAVIAGPGNISTQLIESLQAPSLLPPSSGLTLVVPEGFDPAAALAQPIPPEIVPIEPAKAAGLDVAGATGGLTHPACIAETQRRAAMKPPQPPPNGDFPCVVPTSNASGIVDGVCFVHVCKGVASTGLDGLMSALGSISSLSGIVSGIFSKLLQGNSSAPDSPALTASESDTPVSAPPASSLISADANVSQSFDFPLLFARAALIVQDLLGALQSPDAQLSEVDQ